MASFSPAQHPAHVAGTSIHQTFFPSPRTDVYIRSFLLTPHADGTAGSPWHIDSQFLYLHVVLSLSTFCFSSAASRSRAVRPSKRVSLWGFPHSIPSLRPPHYIAGPLYLVSNDHLSSALLCCSVTAAASAPHQMSVLCTILTPLIRTLAVSHPSILLDFLFGVLHTCFSSAHNIRFIIIYQKI